MPIHLDVSHLHRTVIAVILGEATSDDISNMMQRFVETGALHYRKIIDTSAAHVAISPAQVDAIAATVRADPKASSRGPLAFVVDLNQAEFAEKFAEVTEGERPVKVFGSIHAARKWLDERSKTKTRR
jgi:hypothetical protein